MGAADIIPGVSGGTIALILQIYEELVGSIKKMAEPGCYRNLLKGKFKAAWQHVNGNFLLAVGSGILLAILTLAKLMEHLLMTYPLHVAGFFFGLIFASVFLVIRYVKTWNLQSLGALLLGAAGGFLFVGLVPVSTPDAWWFLVLCGAIVICAMILPGISGSFLLLILGKYQFILSAVNNRDIVSIGLFCIGAAVGIISFSQVLTWLFKKYHDLTMACMAGLMLGSLRKIWPWKVGASEIDMINVLPSMGDRQTPFILILMVIGVTCVFLLDYVSKNGTGESN